MLKSLSPVILAAIAFALTTAANAASLTYDQAIARAKWIDANKDGVLSADEIAAAKHKYGNQVDTIRIAASDVNRDGRITTVEAVNGRAFGEWSRTTTNTTPNGTRTVHAEGNSWKTDDGRAWEVDRTGTNRNGKDWTAHSEGEAQRTANGHVWQSTTTGSNNDGSRTWETDRNGERTVNSDGTISVSNEYEKTLDNGTVITGTKDTTITKTEDGREWETEATRNGPRGESTWTADGTATRTEDGREVIIDREGVRNGNEFANRTEGTVTRDGNTFRRDFVTNPVGDADNPAIAARIRNDENTQNRDAIIADRRQLSDDRRAEAAQKRDAAKADRQTQARDRADAAKAKAKDRASLAKSKANSRPVAARGGNRGGGKK